MNLLNYFSVLLMIYAGTPVMGKIEQTRWCHLQDEQHNGVWVTYSDSVSSCVTCGSVTKLFQNRSDVLKCCSGNFQSECATSCDVNDIHGIRCNNGRLICDTKQCDGYNDCGDGSDEVFFPTCQNNCQVNEYACHNGENKNGRDQCFSLSKVCDGEKNCIGGFDEVNCIYYGGICSNFTCTVLPQCISRNAVCDGVKDCYDGTDEMACFETEKCSRRNGFQCTTQNPVCAEDLKPFSEVCDGKIDCASRIDEQNCYLWSSWSVWSQCNCSSSATSNGMHYRRRNCGTFHNINFNNEGKCNGSRSDNKTCICIPTTQTTQVQTTTTAVTAVQLNVAIITVITLGGVVLLVVVAACIYFCWNECIKRKRRKSNNKADFVYNPHRSLGAESVFSPSGSFASRPTLQFFPSTPLSAGQSSHERPSPMINGSTIQSHSNNIGSTKRKPNFAPPPPPRNEETCENASTASIDPYAVTKNSMLNRSMSTASLSPRSSTTTPTHRRRSASITSSIYYKDDDNMSQSHSSNISLRERPFPQNGLEKQKRKTRSNDRIGKDGYTLPIDSPVHIYTSMNKVQKYLTGKNKQSLTSTMPNSKRHKQGLSKAQRQNLECQRYRRNPQPSKHRLKINKPTIQKHKERSKEQPEDASYYSDSYATMRGYGIDNISKFSLKPTRGKSIESISSDISQKTNVSSQLNQVPLRRHSIDLIGDNIKPQLTVEESTLKPKLQIQNLDENDKNKQDEINSDKDALTSNSDDDATRDDIANELHGRNTKTGYTKVLPKKSRPTSMKNLSKKKFAEEKDQSEDEKSPYSVTTPITSPHFPLNSRNFFGKPEEKPYDVLVRDDIKAKWPIKEEEEKSPPVISPKLYLE